VGIGRSSGNFRGAVLDGRNHVLIVEDDMATRAMVAAYLAEAGFKVVDVGNGTEMRRALTANRVDLVLLDINLPGADGLALAQELRRQSDVGIVFVTSRGSDMDTVVGLELGADDYVVKPFEPRVLLARIKSVLRRRAAQGRNGTVVRFDGWALDLVDRRLTSADGAEVPLTKAEFDVLAALATRAGRLLTRDQIIDATSGPHRAVTDRSIDTLVSRLRRRLGDDSRSPRLIVTYHGQGYKFAARVE